MKQELIESNYYRGVCSKCYLEHSNRCVALLLGENCNIGTRSTMKDLVLERKVYMKVCYPILPNRELKWW